MKLCPKCELPHEKPGKFCSRTCGNSRVRTENLKKHLSEKSKNLWKENPDRYSKLFDKSLSGSRPIDKARQIQAERKKAATALKSFDEVGYDIKRIRVIAEQSGRCARCGIDSWNDLPITLEIDHKNGNNKDHSRDNLEALCPNCHSQTKTWRGRNKGKRVSQEELSAILDRTPNKRQCLIEAGLSPKGKNYQRLKKMDGSCDPFES